MERLRVENIPVQNDFKKYIAKLYVNDLGQPSQGRDGLSLLSTSRVRPSDLRTLFVSDSGEERSHYSNRYFNKQIYKEVFELFYL